MLEMDTWINKANRALDILALRIEQERNPSRLHQHMNVFNALNDMVNQAIEIRWLALRKK